ncbi:Sulfite reduction-associated complex DsrMKJOP iron-sulfur protein DsrO (=HmeA) [invertebrate metagenome]|uniref:Sulfite reduction-associated complex DsrMKJOP iron-sulfur protein DsrO (=HmeA) n=1 Tax=invertebrate metagenome TaxID=1711999 RepID=A0A484H890_9ZZZZ
MSTHRACVRGETCQVPTQSTCTDAVMTERISRRGAMTGALAVVLAVAPDVFLLNDGVAAAKPDDQPVSETIRWGLLVDVTKCAEGCSSCVDACREEHGWAGFGRPATDPQWIRKVSLKERGSGHTVSLPVMCQHCEYPPCVDVCPTGASFRRSDGIVLVDRHICIGCRYCMMACPYNARSFVHEALKDQYPHMPRGKGCVESCTLCAHRIDRDQPLACVKRCTDIGHQALVFGDLNDPSSEIAQRLAAYSSVRIRQDLKTNPGIYYQGL